MLTFVLNDNSCEGSKSLAISPSGESGKVWKMFSHSTLPEPLARAWQPTGTGTTEAVTPGPSPPEVHDIVEDQVNSSVTVQQVSADTEVRERVLREHVEKMAQDEETLPREPGGGAGICANRSPEWANRRGCSGTQQPPRLCGWEDSRK